MASYSQDEMEHSDWLFYGQYHSVRARLLAQEPVTGPGA